MGKIVVLAALLILWIPLQASEKVVLQLQWLPQFQFAGYYMAKEKGFYKEAGLDVKIRPVRPGMDVTEEVLSGRAQFGTGRSSLLIAYDQKKPLVAMAAIFQSSPMVLLVRKDSGIRTVEDLRGKRVMLTGDVQSAAAIQAMLRQAGMTEADLVTLPHSFSADALERNETDAMVAYVSNEPYVLSQEGIETIALDPRTFGFDFYSDILFTSRSELLEDPGRTRRFYEASLKGWGYAFSHLDETAKVLYEKYNSQKKSLEALRYEGETLRQLALQGNAPLGHLSLDRLHAINQAYALLGFPVERRNLDEFIYHPERLILSSREKAWLEDHPILRIGVDPAWPPVEFIGEEGNYGGITSGYMEAIAKKLGVRFELVHRQNWEGVEAAMKTRELDVAAAMMNLPEQREYAMFTAPYLTLPMVIVGGESFSYIGDLTALNGKRVAVAAGYAADQLLQRNFPGITLVRTQDSAEALQQVASGEADAAVGALAVVSYLIAGKGLNTLRIIGQTPYRYELAMGVRNDWPELRALLQKALDSISEQEREAIYRRWVPTVYRHQVDYTLLWKVLGIVAVIALLVAYKYMRLEVLVDKRTRELEELNATLHHRIEHAVEENRKKERMMIQQAKMATIGEMIESIAHQWRQPLNIMGIGISNLDLKRRMGKLTPQELETLIDMAQRQVAYMSQTIDDFRNFFKKDKQRESVRLRPLIDEVTALVMPALRQKRIELKTEVSDEMTANLFPNELKQVILNLVSNAKDALVQREQASRKIWIRAHEHEGSIYLEVEDNGGGVPPEIMEKIFEPYFTTKFEAQGTGIGLYMSKIIVEKNLGGELSVTNRGGGAAFLIVLPQKDETALS